MAERDSDKDYYEILQVHRKAEQEVIDAAYRKLAQKYHPDVSKDPNAARRMKEINVAYQVLGDPNRRMEYDKRFKTRRVFKNTARNTKKRASTTSFLVEFRLHGFAKKYAKWARKCTLREAKELRIKELEAQKFVSHITLFGSAKTNNLKRVAAEIERIGRKYTLVPFKLGWFDNFQNPDANWLYLDAQPSSDLEQLRYELAQNLLRAERMIYDTSQSFDHRLKYKFHSSIGKYAPRDKDKFEKLLDFAKSKCTIESFKQRRASLFGRLINIIKKWIFRVADEDQRINQHLIRITVLGRKSHIYCEYDLVLKKLLSRREALSRHWWRRTIEELRALLGLRRNK